MKYRVIVYSAKYATQFATFRTMREAVDVASMIAAMHGHYEREWFKTIRQHETVRYTPNHRKWEIEICKMR